MFVCHKQALVNHQNTFFLGFSFVFRLSMTLQEYFKIALTRIKIQYNQRSIYAIMPYIYNYPDLESFFHVHHQSLKSPH
jgi:hypothetical protein